MIIPEGSEEFFACLRCGRVSAIRKLSKRMAVPPEETAAEKVEKQFDRDEEDKNATSGNESGVLQQVPLQTEKDKGKGQVQKN